MIVCIKCGKRKKVQRLGRRSHWTCSTCSKGNSKKKSREELITITCDGCLREQKIRKSKLELCDGYTCALGRCNKNPGFKIPKQLPEGYVCQLILNAAGGFSGYRIQVASPEEVRSVARAIAIRDAGIAAIRQTRDQEFIN